MMLKYEKYKDSGIVWLDDIPEHWGASRLKDYSTKIQTGTTPKTSVLKYWENEDYNWFTPSDFTSSLSLVDSDRKINAIAIQENAARLFYKDSVLIIGIASVGKVGILAADSSANQQINSITFDRRVIPLFGAYFLKIYEDEIVKFANYSIVPIFNQTETGCLKFVAPPIPEQTAIVNYLDPKIAKLDKLIKNKEDQIARLNKIRQIEINTAVTKGLNPNVKMKNSGIEWIGEIPEHWDVIRLKGNTYIKGRIGWQNLRTDEFIDDGPFCITGTDFQDGLVNWDTCYHVSEERYNVDVNIQLRKNDLLITKDGTIGKTALIDELLGKATLNSGIMVIRPLIKAYHTRFFYWILNSEVFTQYNEYTKTGTTILHLYQNVFERFKFPVPLVPEQTAIANYLGQKTAKLDKIIRNIEDQIEKLNKIRKIEIYNAVTGKIKVV